MPQRIVVTGAGVISPLGYASGAGLEKFGEALWSGTTGIQPSARFPGRTIAEFTDFNPTPWLGNKGVRILDRGTRFLGVGVQMALSSTGLLEAATEPGDPGLGLVAGTLFGGIHSIASFDMTNLMEGPSYVSPMEFPNTVLNAPAGQIAIKSRLRGVNSTICTGLASGLSAIQYAADFLRFGRAKYLMAGGFEEVCEEASLGFKKLNLASPTGQVQPFGTDRDGTASGEGCALWVLMTEETAHARGLTPWFEIAGYGSAHDGQTILGYQVKAEGATAAIQQALDDAGIGAEQIACIVASANGSRTGDEMEVRALRNVFGESLATIPVSAPKAAVGEAMGASGAYCAVTAGLALQKQEAPPTAGFSSSDTGLKLSSQPQPFSGDYALINAFSCDGNNASMVIRLWKK